MKHRLLILLLAVVMTSCKTPEEQAWNSIGDPARMAKLLDAGLDPNLEGGAAPRKFLLQSATEMHRADTVKVLLDRGADPDKRTWGYGKTSLFLAAYGKNLKIAQMLVDSRADVNATDDNGNTALREAIGVKSAKMVELLLKNGANPMIRNKSGESMLDLARKHGTPEIVTLLENSVEQATASEDDKPAN